MSGRDDMERGASAWLERWAGEDGSHRRMREAAFGRWREIPEPTRRDEDWRRSDPRWFDPSGLELASPPEPGEAGFDDPLHALYDVVVSIGGGRYAVQDRSGVLAAGRLTVAPLAGSGSNGGSGSGPSRPVLPDSVLPTDRFEAWADAFWGAGFRIEVPAGAELERGVLIDYRLPDGRFWHGSRLCVEVGEGARFHVAERMAGGSADRAQVAARREVTAGPGARVRVVTMQTLEQGTSVLGWDGARLEAGAHVDWVTLPLGGGAVRTRFATEAAGPEAEAGMYGLCFGAGRQHIEQKTLQVHSAPDTRSTLLYKSLVRDEARSVFQGIIVARRGAQRIDAYQKNKNLVLNDGARADSLPGLLIDADDLRCSHGATIGTLDPDQMHYLRSRGLSETEAGRLLIEGFAGDILQHLSHPALRDAAQVAIGAKI